MLVNNLLVVGSGSAGLITAIILKKKLDITVDILHSSSVGIVGVGEGSTEHFKEFLLLTGIDHYDLIRECNATYKSGIMFDGWGEKRYLHNISTPFEFKNGQYRILYGDLISNNKQITPLSIWENKIPKHFLHNSDIFPADQFHFDTYKLNLYLQKM